MSATIDLEKAYELFNLNKEEKIIDAFDCFLIETFPVVGQLYLTEKNICFYSNLPFFNRNITIPLEEIKKLSLNNINIEIELKNKINSNSKYSFTFKENVQNYFEKIKTVYDSYTNKKNEKNKSPDISKKSEIIEKIEFGPIDPEEDFEVCKKIININPKYLFNKCHTKEFPETNYEKYYEWVGNHSNIKLSDWEKVEDSEKEKFKRTESFSLSLEGVPFVDHSDVVKTTHYYIDKKGTYHLEGNSRSEFVDHSDVVKTTHYYIDKKGTYHLEGNSRSEGIPFADCFTIKNKMEFYPYDNNTKTVFRTYVRTNFLKSTFVKPILISQTKKSYTEEIEKWLDFIQEKGLTVEGDYAYEEKVENFPEDKNKNIKKKNYIFVAIFLLIFSILMAYIFSNKRK